MVRRQALLGVQATGAHVEGEQRGRHRLPATLRRRSRYRACRALRALARRAGGTRAGREAACAASVGGRERHLNADGYRARSPPAPTRRLHRGKRLARCVPGRRGRIGLSGADIGDRDHRGARPRYTRRPDRLLHGTVTHRSRVHRRRARYHFDARARARGRGATHPRAAQPQRRADPRGTTRAVGPTGPAACRGGVRARLERPRQHRPERSACRALRRVPVRARRVLECALLLDRRRHPSQAAACRLELGRGLPDGRALCGHARPPRAARGGQRIAPYTRLWLTNLRPQVTGFEVFDAQKTIPPNLEHSLSKIDAE